MSQTLWLGTQPQWNSSEIRLTDSWTYGGFSVSVSFPPGVGFTVAGNTVSWTGSDASGEVWGLQDMYYAIAAEGLLNRFRQVSLGSHLFRNPSVSTWVNVSASASCRI